MSFISFMTQFSKPTTTKDINTPLTATHQELLQELVVGEDAVVHDDKLSSVVRHVGVTVNYRGHTCKNVVVCVCV
jgi:hypothetical protein